MSRPPKSFEELPVPADEAEARLALQLGMIILQGMKDVEEMEMFSGLPGTFKAEVGGAKDARWAITVGKV